LLLVALADAPEWWMRQNGGCARMVDAPEWWVRLGESVRSELWMCPGIALLELLADLFVSSVVEFQVGHVVHSFYFV
jgi:hypothetical protein